MMRHVFVLWDVIFKEGQPHCTLLSMGENESEDIPLPLFNMNDAPLNNNKGTEAGTTEAADGINQVSSTPINQVPIIGNDSSDPGSGDKANHRDITITGMQPATELCLVLESPVWSSLWPIFGKTETSL
jgi:hypothetical protein